MLLKLEIRHVGDDQLDRGKWMYEVGWRIRRIRICCLIFGLSLRHKNAVRAATSLSSVNSYEAKNAKAYGGTFG